VALDLRGMPWFLLLIAPQQACSLAGREHGRSIPFSDLTGFLTHLRGRSQKFASADVSRFTSIPHVWSDRQVGHFNVGEKHAYPLSRPRDVCDHLRNRRNCGRS
jgi:hypothetical protein